VSVRKAERLLNLVALLLETRRPVTAQQIRETVPGYGQEEWDSFKRMFERDKDELREMGIPVELAPTDAWEVEEGYRIPKDRYYLPELALAEDEMAALVLAAGLVRLEDPQAARSALLKLSPDAPAPDAGVPWLSANLGLAVPGLARAFAAVAERKRITFRYRSRSGVQVRTLDPYGLVHRKGAWYVTGLDHATGQQRSFRIDRVEGELHQNDPGHPGPQFEVPPGFRPQEALEVPPFLQGDAVEVAHLRFAPSTAWWVGREAPWLELVARDDGSAEATLAVSDVGGFVGWVLWYGEGVEVLGPPALRVAILRRLEETCG
jgi:predicted DNA-binding transcriptional regulator YafY